MRYTYERNFAREARAKLGSQPAEVCEFLAGVWYATLVKHRLPGFPPAPIDSVETRIEAIPGRAVLYFGWYDFKGTTDAALKRFDRYRQAYAIEAREAMEWRRLSEEL